MASLFERAAGHFWTLAPFLRNHAAPPQPEPSKPWSTWIDDPSVGRVRLSGRLAAGSDSNALLLVVHGLGGSADSHYMAAATRAARHAGLASLRLNLRGADREGHDFYHAGLTEDLDAALSCPELARYREIFLFGYSLGGHVSLRWATKPTDPRVRAVAAVCAPLDLDRSAAAFDRPERFIYRQHVLRGLVEMYRGVSARRSLPLSARDASRIRTIREWDHRVIAARHGFDSAEHYYSEMSVAGRIGAIRLPSLLVAAEQDPMVPADTVRPALRAAPEALDVRWVRRGGHVGFPDAVDLGIVAPFGLEQQVVGWLIGAG